MWDSPAWMLLAAPGGAPGTLAAGDVPVALAVTLNRLAQGFALGALAGLLGGLLLARLRRLRTVLRRLLSMLQAAPLLALLPVLMLFLGVSEAARVALVAVTCFLLVALHTLDAVEAIDPAFAVLAANYGAGKLALLKKVYLPAALPRIFTGLRRALTTGFVMTVATELVVPEGGLGGMIVTGWHTSVSEVVYVGALLSIVFAVALDAALRHFEAVLFPWSD